MTIEIALFHQSLDIYDRIGDAQGKAVTLWWLGKLLADEEGDFATAIAHLKESLSILQKIGSPDAAEVQELCDRIQNQAEQKASEGKETS